MKQRKRQHTYREFHKLCNGQTHVEPLVEAATELGGPLRHPLLTELIKNAPRHNYPRHADRAVVCRVADFV